MAHAKQFKRLKGPLGETIYEGYAAIFPIGGEEICIIAPTMAILELRWADINPFNDLKRDLVQHVVIKKFTEKK